MSTDSGEVAQRMLAILAPFIFPAEDARRAAFAAAIESTRIAHPDDAAIQEACRKLEHLLRHS